MSILKDIKYFFSEKQAEDDESDSEDKMAMLVVAAFLGIMALVLIGLVLSIVWWIAKSVFPFALVVVLFYGFGVYKWGWKIPRIKRK